MKVLLLKDVRRLGKAGEVKEVADGFGANYLLPKGLAVKATPGVLKEYQERIKAQQAKQEHAVETAEQLARIIGQTVLTFTVRASEKGKMYGSVTSGDIVARLQEVTGKSIDRRKLALEQPIRELGTYRVPVKLMPNIVPELTVVVSAEGEGEKE